MLHTHIRNSLSVAIAIALTAAVTVPSRIFAQQPATTTDAQAASAKPDSTKDSADKDAANMETITVTGYRYSIEKSLDQKREANSIVDVITAEDVSKFPDKNVADALQRVPGVIITRDATGEGQNVSVRGLASDLTLTELNGNYIATAEGNGEATRSFNYTLLPANMLASAELYKSPEARLDEGGVGGTAILRTRRPLDLPSNSGFVSAEGVWSNTTRDADPQVSGMYSWHSDDDRFGFLAGLTYQKRESRSMGVSTEDYQWYSDAANSAVDVNGHSLASNNGIHYWWGQSGFYSQSPTYTPGAGKYYSNFFMPTSVDFGVTDDERERTGVQLTGQFKPTNNLTFTANYFRFELTDNTTVNMLKVPEWNLARFSGDGTWPYGRHLDGLSFDPSHTIVNGAQYSLIPGKPLYCSTSAAGAAGVDPVNFGGSSRSGGWGADDCSMPTPQLTGSFTQEKALSQTVDLEAQWHTDFIDADFKGGRTWAGGGPSTAFRMSAKPRVQLPDGTFASGNTYGAWSLAGTPSMTFSPNLMQNLRNGIAEIDVGSTDSSWTRNSIQQNYFQGDFTKHFDSDWFDSIQFGAKYRDGGAHRNTGNNYWVCPGLSAAPDQTTYNNNRYQVCDSTASQFKPQFLIQQPLTNIAGGFTASTFPAINYPAYLAYLNQTYGGMHTRNEPNFVYDVNEKIWSTYFQANFKTDRFRGNVGVRVARTQQLAESTDQVNNNVGLFERDPSGNVINCLPGGVPPPGFSGQACQGGFLELPGNKQQIQSVALSKVNRTYTDVLPSANFAYDLTSDLVLRGAASKVIARPSYTDIAYPGSLNYNSPQYIADRTLIGGAGQPGWSGSGSNKYLEPYKATQYDIGLEWYFQQGSVVGADLFRKNVSNFTVPVVLNQTMNIGGTNQLVQQYSTQAGGRNGISQGLELYAQHTFEFGLGFQVNYTYNDTNEAAITLNGVNIGESPLVGSAKKQANATVFYENKEWLLRASFNHRGVVVDGLQNGMNVYEAPYNQLDLNAAYNVNEHFTLTGSVLNVAENEQRAYLGNDTKNRFYSNNYAGRTVYFGATYKF